MMMYITFFWSIVLFIYLLLTIIFKDKKIKYKKINNMSNTNEDEELSLYKRMISPIVKKTKKSFRRKLKGQSYNKIEKKILQAGNPFNLSPIDFRLIQISITILFIVISCIYGIIVSSNIISILSLIIAAFLVGLILPNCYLSSKTKKRSIKGLKELPDVVDLLTVSLEAGLGFDLALHKLISRKNGIIPSEFEICLEEIRLGKPRKRALKEITERLLIEELNTLINSILRAEKLGISMVQVLRTQSKEIREKRRQRAEEQAAKAPIKMLFPLIFFIFPSLFIILLGPVLIQFMQTFGK